MPRYLMEPKKESDEGESKKADQSGATISDWAGALRGALEEKLKPTEWDKFDPPVHLLKTVAGHLTKGEISEVWGALKKAHAEKEVALEHHAAEAEKWKPIDPDYELRRSGPMSFDRARTEYSRAIRGIIGPVGVPGQPAPAPRHRDTPPASSDPLSPLSPLPPEGLLQLMRWLRGGKASGAEK